MLFIRFSDVRWCKFDKRHIDERESYNWWFKISFESIFQTCFSPWYLQNSGNIDLIFLNYLDIFFMLWWLCRRHGVKTLNVCKVICKCIIICLRLQKCFYAECGFFIIWELHVQKFTFCFVVLTFFEWWKSAIL